MPSFTTLNKFDAQGHPIKYDNYRTEAEAIARVAELHDMGLTDAFYIDDNATAVNGTRCFQKPQHWVADPIAKTITLNQASLDAEIREGHMTALRSERDKRLEESDKNVLPDRWHTMNTATQAKWATYRQELRDLLATADPANPVWPTVPSKE